MTLIAPALLEILRCPLCHQTVVEDVPASLLRCSGCGHEYPVVDGIPDMVVGHD
jgi:uncharacterized protein YbaR (Trm112 family)